MAGSYLPTREADLDTWLANFKTLIAATPTNYGLVSSDGTAITTAFNNWHSAYLAAVNPTTRSALTVQAKNAQKAIVIPLVRSYAGTIQANHAVSDSLKMGLGLHVRDATPTPVPPPSTKPVLKITKTDQGFQDLQAADEATPLRRARPTGSVGLLVYRFIGADSTSEPGDATFLTFVGKPSFESTFSTADRGKTVTYFARWTNARGEVGPWSFALSAQIAA